jgi:hypothetical protein
MAGVNVAACYLEGHFSVETTDFEGKFVVDGPGLDQTSFEVAVIQGHRVLAREQLSTDGPTSFELKIAEEPTIPAVVIRLRDATTGAPIRNATIRSIVFPLCGWDNEGDELRSAPRAEPQEVEPGLYRVPFVPFGFREFGLGIRAIGYGSVHTDRLALTNYQDYGPIEFVMSPSEHVRVRVMNEFTGKPLVGSVVELDGGSEYAQSLDWILGRRMTTDASGVARFDDVPAGNYRVLIDRDPSRECWTEEIVVEAGKTKEINATIKAYAKLRIVVVDSEGKPIEPGMTTVTRNGVQLEGDFGYDPSAWYVFRSFDVGRCRVEVRSGGLGEQILTADADLRSGEATSVVFKAKP